MIEFIFPHPGQWSRFKIVSHWQDADGYTHTDTTSTVPAEHAAALQSVIESIVALDAPWQATLVTACLATDSLELPNEQQPIDSEVVLLTVYATRPGESGTKPFDHNDYPALKLTDAASIAFFKHINHKANP